MIFFMVALAHSEIDDFEKILHKYIDVSGRYLIGMETAPDSHAQTGGQHFHIAADMSNKQYDTFRKTVLVKKYGLQGQAKDGHARQYGIVRKVRDETAMMSYSCKDKNIRSNFELDELQKFIDASFKKKPILDHLEKMMSEIAQSRLHTWDQDIGKMKVDTTSVEFRILEYYMDQDLKKVLNKASLKSLTTRYLMYYEKTIPRDTLIQQLYYYINF